MTRSWWTRAIAVAIIAVVGPSSCVVVERSPAGQDASGPDASTGSDATALPDAVPPDATLVPDAADAGPVPDASNDVDAGNPSPCLGSHTFCRDFDDGELATGFTGGVTAPAGTLLELSSAFSVSPQRSLHVQLPRRLGSAIGELRVAPEWQVLGPWKRVHLEVDVYLPATMSWQAGDAPLALLGIYYGSSGPSAPSAGSVLAIGESSSSLSVLSENLYPFIPNLLRGSFNHIALTVDPLLGKMEYSVNGVPGSRTFAAVTPGNDPQYSVFAGARSFLGPSPAIDVYIDNLVVDVE